jgi:hypothetical protein
MRHQHVDAPAPSELQHLGFGWKKDPAKKAKWTQLDKEKRSQQSHFCASAEESSCSFLPDATECDIVEDRMCSADSIRKIDRLTAILTVLVPVDKWEWMSN